MAELVDEKTEDRMLVKIYPNQQLGSERENLELLHIGSIGMTKISSAILKTNLNVNSNLNYEKSI